MVVVERSLQTSAVRIQSSATFVELIFPVTVCRKDENKEKEAENGPFKNVVLD